MTIDPSVTLTPESWRVLLDCIRARDWSRASSGRRFIKIIDEAEQQVNETMDTAARQESAFKRRRDAEL